MIMVKNNINNYSNSNDKKMLHKFLNFCDFFQKI